jgi:hypothetical protein
LLNIKGSNLSLVVDGKISGQLLSSVGILGFLLPQVTTFLAKASHFAIKKRVTNARQIPYGPASAAFSLAIYQLAAFTLFQIVKPTPTTSRCHRRRIGFKKLA